MKFISKVFTNIAGSGVNVDMISQTAPIGDKTNISFTVSDNDLGKVLAIFSELRSDYPSIKSDISSNNCKISLSGEQMMYMPGVAAKVFDIIAENESRYKDNHYFRNRHFASYSRRLLSGFFSCLRGRVRHEDNRSEIILLHYGAGYGIQ
jgi:hypothetical protein